MGYGYSSHHLDATSVVQLVRTSSIMRVVDRSENFLIFHITYDSC